MPSTRHSTRRYTPPLNSGLLYLEIFSVLVNAVLAWLV